jgi:hypothetical protein
MMGEKPPSDSPKGERIKPPSSSPEGEGEVTLLDVLSISFIFLLSFFSLPHR